VRREGRRRRSTPPSGPARACAPARRRSPICSRSSGRSNGCSPLDNGEPAAGGIDCTSFNPFADASTIHSGETKVFGDLKPGIVRFQCMIHPWMRSTVEVRANGGRG